MNISIKLFGMLLIMAAAFLIGNFKASGIKRRIEQLEEIYINTTRLKEYISYGGDELDSAINKCFAGNRALDFSCGKVCSYSKDLNSEDIRMLDDIFLSLGSGYSEDECRRIDLFLDMLKISITKARDEAAGKTKLYKTAGVSAGLAICIFLI